MEKEWTHSKSPFSEGLKWRSLNHNGFIETTECTSDRINENVLGWTLFCCGGGRKPHPIHSWPNKVNDFPQPVNDF